MRRDDDRWEFDELVRRFVPRRRKLNPLLVIWRWRYELALGLGIPYGFSVLAGAIHPIAAVGLALAAGVGCGWWPPGRRVVAEGTQVVLVQHRLRVGMVQANIMSWSGRLPAILLSSPRPRGVRVLLWCPAGVDVHAFHANRSLLAAACWAADVEITRHPTRSQLVVLLVVTEPDR
ncbi:hypothetical protein ACQPZQ_00265 [Pseudonocardia sp. CA-142604]|uniref:hypothetical protein n=1 Tax=Pseudonocardia sp. CA-142604 TaxID=3240024 RepID=UPI003D931C52